MTKQERQTRVMRAVKMDSLPAEKWPQVVKRTVLGIAFMAFGAIGAMELEWPWYVVGGFATLGATIWSTQLVVGALKALLEPVRAYKALAGKDGAE
jgi:hypothetical protein